MGVYSNTEILDGIKSSNIVIDPFDPMHVNGSSYDVTLGHYFFRSGLGASDHLYNPYMEEEVDAHFGKLMEATPYSEHTKAINVLGITAPRGVAIEHPVILLRPGERILAHTNEFIGIRSGTTSMQARSTTGRNGIVVCMDAGWGDPGYINRWTMEILNHNEQWVLLPIGIRIAQIVFHRTGVVSSEYSELSGKYQSTSGADLAEVKKLWRPENAMKPKSFKDKIKLPVRVTGLSEDIK